MAHTKHYKELVSFLGSVGFSLERTNSKGFEIYSHPAHAPVGLNPSISGTPARHLLRNLQRKLTGATELSGRKRQPAKIKDRQAAERAKAHAEVEARQAEIAALLAQRDERMGRVGFSGTDAEFRELIARIEKEERELRYWRQLMTEIPRNENTVRHRS